MQDPNTGKMVGVGREFEGLYYLVVPNSPIVCSMMDSFNVIHSHLGHPSLSKLQKMVPYLSNLKSLVRESCQKGKHTHSSFSSSVGEKRESPFSLIHSDIWDPSHVSSRLGFQYFVTCIDDYSRYTWVFLMKNSAKLFSIFQKFCAKIKTQFGKSIHVSHSDNAREFLSNQLQDFMAKQGILHQTTCPHTPQQNGLAEDKNRQFN